MGPTAATGAPAIGPEAGEAVRAPAPTADGSEASQEGRRKGCNGDGPGAAPPDRRAEPPGPRSPRRDRVVTVACILLAAAFGALGTLDAVGSELDLASPADLLVMASGAVACLALVVRRRWPLGLAVALVPLGAVSPAASGAVIIAMFSVAIHRRHPVAIAIGIANTATLPLYLSLYPEDQWPMWISLPVVAVIHAAVVGWGMFVRAQRQLVLALRERAAEAEAERDLRVTRAREDERTRIAREMHDVLAHRISLLSLHAGALEFRPGAPAQEIARAAGVVRASAHQALEELRQVVDVLRAQPDVADGAQRPQPTLADLPALIEESRAAGTHVRLDERVTDPASAPEATGRTAYRVVQEGLTNARKHAPEAAVGVTVYGTPDAGLTVEVRNRRPLARLGATEVPGSGTGLVGLAERVSLAGGRLEHGRTTGDEFRLAAWLPWAA